MIVPTKNNKLQYFDLKCDIITYQLLEVFNNFSVLDEYDLILIDEFGLFSLPLL